MRLLLMLIPLIANAEGLEGKWNGSFFYEAGKPGIHFLAEIQESGNAFSGEITEPNAYESAGAREISAHVEGRRDGARLRFEKSYDGTGGIRHTVDYQGYYANGRISGHWRLGEASGNFEMIRIESPVGDPVVPEPKKKKR